MRGATPSHVSPEALPRVVIVGAGFGGLSAAQALKSAPIEITLVDRRNFHLFQPLLYQVATATLSPGDIAWPVRSIFARQKNVRVMMLDVRTVDTIAKTVSDGVTTLAYDYLIVATGATHAYLCERLLSACELAERSESDEVRQRCLTTVIIGGGATGVEMAGAVAELSRRTLKGEFRRIDPEKMRIVLVEAGPRLLSAFPEALSDRAAAPFSSGPLVRKLSPKATPLAHTDLKDSTHRYEDGAGLRSGLWQLRVKLCLPPWGPHVRFRRVQTLVREGSPLVKLRNSALGIVAHSIKSQRTPLRLTCRPVVSCLAC